MDMTSVPDKDQEKSALEALMHTGVVLSTCGIVAFCNMEDLGCLCPQFSSKE